MNGYSIGLIGSLGTAGSNTTEVILQNLDELDTPKDDTRGQEYTTMMLICVGTSVVFKLEHEV